MPRPNKIEIFADENRMSPRWEKGPARRKRKREMKYIGKGGGGGHSGREVEMESRAKEAREVSMEKREERKGDRRQSYPPSPSFLLHDGGRIGK